MAVRPPQRRADRARLPAGALVAPVLLAAGLAGVVASLFTWWPYGVVGAVVALAALWAVDPRRAPASSPGCRASSG